MSTLTEVKVNVRNIAVGGAGVGEVYEQSDGGDDLLGITAFVPFTAVGEKVRAGVTENKKRYLKTELIGVESAAPERVEPSCNFFTVCGGCELQHISYEGQLRAKFEMIHGALKAAKLPGAVLDSLREVVPGSPYNYRRRVNLHIDTNGRVGFYRENSRSVVQIDSCSVSVPEIGEALANIQEFGGLVQGKVSSLRLESDPKGLVAVLVATHSLSDKDIKEILSVSKAFFSNVSILSNSVEVGGYGRQILELPLNRQGTFFLRVPAASFSQVNWDVNLSLIEEVVRSAQVSYGEPIYDLYAGAGNFTLPLARSGGQVTAVECDKRLVSFGRENAKRNSLGKKITYHESSVEIFLKDTSHRSGLVIADPPRSGLGKLIPSLQFPDRLLLIGCHLPSFVRDIKNFVDLGWKVESLTPFDMFAQTSYVEVLGVLRK